MSKLTAEDLALVGEPQIGLVATVMADGSPQITPVWVESDGEAIVFNTAVGRIKHTNLARQAVAAISVVDAANQYRWVSIRGRVEMTTEGAEAQIDRLAKKYLGADTYPWRTPGEVRVSVRILADHRTGMH